MQITKAAVEEFKKIVSESGEKDAGIRIVASRSGCCGTSFSLEVTGTGESGDKTVMVDGLKVFMPSDTEDKLADSTIDYSESCCGGFTIRGSSSSSCCG
jgi:iron-sulfur cluster assembly accessory protein